MRRLALTALAAAALTAAGCSGSGSHSGSATTTSSQAAATATGSATTASTAAGGRYAGRAFATRVDNPWFPLLTGARWVYRGEEDGTPTREIVVVTGRTRRIAGVRCTEVLDRLWAAGRLEERTSDWYAEDTAGTVWYFGEATAELTRSGAVKTREGSWLTGKNGARAGIFMPLHPRVGQSFRQEYLKGHAEDHFRVARLKVRVATPGATSRHALLTEEWTPLEPGVLDHKVYVRGVGTVFELTVHGGNERNELVRYEAP